MLQQTAQNVNDIVDHLASKLSVPATQLWTILVNQARVDAIQTIATDAMWLTFIVVYAVSLRRVVGWLNAKDTSDDVMTGGIIWLVGGGFVSVVGALYIVFTLGGIITSLGNPQYFALERILDVLKK